MTTCTQSLSYQDLLGKSPPDYLGELIEHVQRQQSNLCQPRVADAQRRITQMNRNAPAFRRRRSSARLWEQLRGYFEVRFRAEKYGVPYFSAESEAKQSGPRKEAVGARARSGRGFKCTDAKRWA